MDKSISEWLYICSCKAVPDDFTGGFYLTLKEEINIQFYTNYKE
jgi:hypothetical protein